MKTKGNKELRKIIGNNIRKLRKGRGYTMEKLSSLIDISPTFLGLIERGVRGCTLDKLINVADFFGVTINDLIYSDVDKEKIKKSSNDVETIKNLCGIMTDKEVALLLKVQNVIIEGRN